MKGTFPPQLLFHFLLSVTFCQNQNQADDDCTNAGSNCGSNGQNFQPGFFNRFNGNSNGNNGSSLVNNIQGTTARIPLFVIRRRTTPVPIYYDYYDNSKDENGTRTTVFYNETNSTQTTNGKFCHKLSNLSK